MEALLYKGVGLMVALPLDKEMGADRNNANILLKRVNSKYFSNYLSTFLNYFLEYWLSFDSVFFS
jgi:hypothetical protein